MSLLDVCLCWIRVSVGPLSLLDLCLCWIRVSVQDVSLLDLCLYAAVRSLASEYLLVSLRRSEHL